MPVKQDDIKALSDAELEQVAIWSQDEKRVRAERRKAEAMARIKELAASVGVTVAIHGQRGRPAKSKAGRSGGQGDAAKDKVMPSGR